jgi:hypothetical protein
MVNNIEELKNLILWCKEQKVKSLKVAEYSFELSNLALIEDLKSVEDAILNEDKNTVVQKDLMDLQQTPEEDAEDLYWSST